MISRFGTTVADLLRAEISEEEKPIADYIIHAPRSMDDLAIIEVWVDFGEADEEKYRKTYKLKIVKEVSNEDGPVEDRRGVGEARE